MITEALLVKNTLSARMPGAYIVHMLSPMRSVPSRWSISGDLKAMIVLHVGSLYPGADDPEQILDAFDLYISSLMGGAYLQIAPSELVAGFMMKSSFEPPVEHQKGYLADRVAFAIALDQKPAGLKLGFKKKSSV